MTIIIKNDILIICVKLFYNVAETVKNTSNYYQFAFVLQTELKIEELVSLKREEIDFKKHTIIIKRTMNLYVHITDEKKEKEIRKFEPAFQTV